MRLSLKSWQQLPKTIREIVAQHEVVRGQEIQACGWVKSVRHQKRVVFADINDGSCTQDLQAIIRPEHGTGLQTGVSVSLTGLLAASPGKQQSCELQVSQLKILGSVEADYPIQKNLPSNVLFRNMPHLRLRTTQTAAMLRFRDACARSITDELRRMDFFQTEAPVLTSSDCEGGSAVFRVESSEHLKHQALAKPFFAQSTYLSVSTQLYLEALSASLGRVFTLAPAFRAERSLTSRHLAEFWMLEAEMSFIDQLEHVMTVVERIVKAAQAAAWASNDFDLFAARPVPSTAPWPRMTYTEAIDLLQQRAGLSVPWGDDLSTEQERWLAETHAAGPVFVTDYPASLKPFYMRLNDDQKTVACFDLLVPRVGELAGGSLREERPGPLQTTLASKGMPEADYGWYLDLRRHGSVPHGGFGMGWERLVSFLTGVDNVRECVAFPRGSEGWEV